MATSDTNSAVTESAAIEEVAAEPTPRPAAARKPKHRFETFEATRPDGSTVKVKRNIDTGESELVGG